MLLAGVSTLAGVAFLASSPAAAASAKPAATSPSIGVHAPASVAANSKANFSVVFKVKSSAPSVRVNVDWGDGSVKEYSFRMLCVARKCSTAPVKLPFAHTYSRAGTYTPFFTVMDAGRVLAPHALSTTVVVS